MESCLLLGSSGVMKDHTPCGELIRMLQAAVGLTTHFWKTCISSSIMQKCNKPLLKIWDLWLSGKRIIWKQITVQFLCSAVGK